MPALQPRVNGFFPFTNPQRDELELEEWKKHFEAKGIRTKVVEEKNGFVLYREGKDANSLPRNEKRRLKRERECLKSGK